MARAGDIASALGLAPATLSFRLSALRHAGLVRCEAAGRERFYRAAFERMYGLVDHLTENCCGGDDCRQPRPARRSAWASPRPIPAGACCSCAPKTPRAASSPRACSLGPRPLPRVQRRQQFARGDPATGAGAARGRGLPTEGLRSKAIDEFLGPDAPALDFIITVCDAAAEQCPVFPGRPVTAHWSTPDPAAVSGDHDTRMQAFRRAQAVLERRVRLFVGLPLAALDRLAQAEQVRALGRDEGN